MGQKLTEMYDKWSQSNATVLKYMTNFTLMANSSINYVHFEQGIRIENGSRNSTFLQDKVSLILITFASNTEVKFIQYYIKFI